MARPTGPQGPPPPASSEGPASHTRRMPQMLVEPSSGVLQSALVPGGDSDSVGPTQPTLSRPRLVVMEEQPIGLADALARLGYLVRMASTGVEAMSMCAEHAPVAVVVGPGDPERRRILTTALRLRFGAVVVVHVLPDADVGPRPDGVHAVLPWPLPPPPEVMRAIPFQVAPPPEAPSTQTVTRVVPPAAGLRARSMSDLPELSADASEEADVGAFAPLPAPPTTTPPAPSASLPPEATLSQARPRGAVPSDDGLATLQVARVSHDPTRDGLGTDATTPGGAPVTASTEGVAALLGAAVPLLWRLDAAARYLDGVGHREAAAHADTIRDVARLLATLQQRLPGDRQD